MNIPKHDCLFCPWYEDYGNYCICANPIKCYESCQYTEEIKNGKLD